LRTYTRLFTLFTLGNHTYVLRIVRVRIRAQRSPFVQAYQALMDERQRPSFALAQGERGRWSLAANFKLRIFKLRISKRACFWKFGTWMGCLGFRVSGGQKCAPMQHGPWVWSRSWFYQRRLISIGRRKPRPRSESLRCLGEESLSRESGRSYLLFNT
jgi:hypothetical protein